METVTKRLYEAMFLVDTALAASDWQGVNDTIGQVLAKADADIVSMKKWDERRLAYDVDGKSRGTYILVYFRCDTDKITDIERSVRLSERIMRVLVLRTDRMSADDMNKQTPLEEVESSDAAAVEAARARAEARRLSEEEEDNKDEIDDDDFDDTDEQDNQ
ncbi:MAG: 30S ribosomal protein S6 [Sedimentisphaerales bacterium]|nr:30S ribosomal protein S6 [Sedimentisphaerales bacterium]